MTTKTPNLKTPDLKAVSTWIATWFGAGFMRPAPGTWGSLASIPFALILFMIKGWPLVIICAAALYPLAIWSAREFAAATGNHDDKQIVIDEVIGQWIALCPALALTGMNPIYIALSFALFRLFDICKPWPISFFDKQMPNATGVILDDVAAGLYAALLSYGIIIGVQTYAQLG